MDIKTLQYMESRVVKAKKLLKRIDAVSEGIELISNSDSLCDLSVRVKSNGSRDLIRRYEGTESSPSERSQVELYEILRPVLLNEFIDKRKKLQNELEEI
jgi:hypothetical protein